MFGEKRWKYFSYELKEKIEEKKNIIFLFREWSGLESQWKIVLWELGRKLLMEFLIILFLFIFPKENLLFWYCLLTDILIIFLLKLRIGQ